jgi:hypothetical protein
MFNNTRINFDDCAHRLRTISSKESYDYHTFPDKYRNQNKNFNVLKKCHDNKCKNNNNCKLNDKTYNVSPISLRIDIESELKGQKLINSKCPGSKYLPCDFNINDNNILNKYLPNNFNNCTNKYQNNFCNNTCYNNPYLYERFFNPPSNMKL